MPVKRSGARAFSRWRAGVLVGVTAAAWGGCNGIVGNQSASLSLPSDGSVPLDAGVDGVGPLDSGGGGGEAGVDGDAALPPGDGGCAGDISCDSHNCGAIGHDCLGGACTGGLCPLIVLANSQISPDGVAVDDQYVFWTNAGSSQLGYTDGSVHRASNVDGSNPMAIAVAQNSPSSIALDTADVYWCNYGTGDIVMSAKDGSGNRTLAAGILNVSAIALDPPRIYAGVVINASVDGGNGSVGSIPEDGGSYLTLSAGQFNPQSILFDMVSSHLFWANYGSYADGSGGSIESRAVSGFGSPQRLAGATGATQVAYDGTNLYWNNSRPIDGGSIGTVSADGGGGAYVVSSLAGPGGVAVDAVHVYYADAGTIWRVLKNGTERLALATNQNQPGFVVTDDSYVYWADVGSTQQQNGEVVKVAK